MIPTVFRVIREEVDGRTVRILLEPYFENQVATLHEGDEFITGTMKCNPWDGKP